MTSRRLIWGGGLGASWIGEKRGGLGLSSIGRAMIR